MSHHIDNMAYVGSTPWHGLGNAITADLLAAIQSGSVPVEELLNIAGLNWKVQRRAIAMRPGDYVKGTSDPLAMLTSQLDAYRAIVRSDTNEVFQVASNRYQPVQNADIVEFFREYCEAGHATIETLGSLKGGAVVWCLARLNGGSTSVIGGSDELRGYILLATSHDGSVTTTGKPTQIRAVCWNTLSQSLGYKFHGRTNREEKTFRMRHSRKFDQSAKNEAREVMGMAIEQISTMNDIAEKLSTVKVDAAGRLQFLDTLLGNGGDVLSAIVDESSAASTSLDAIVDRMDSGNPEEKLSRVGKAILDAIIDSPGSTMDSANGTAWGLVNGVTWFADHVSKTRSADNRLYSSWFGPNEALKAKALQTAMDMSGVR
jgi:phage/plasmid-like protein (TIGR03299 family)